MGSNGTLKELLAPRMLGKAGYDVLMAVLAMQMALWLRYALANGEGHDLFYLWMASATNGLIAAVVFSVIGLQRGIWRYSSIEDVIQILKAVTISTVLFVLAMFFLTRLENLPRSVPLLQWPILVGLLAGSRLSYRMLRSGDFAAFFRHDTQARIPILLAGPSELADPFIREVQRLGPKGFEYRIVGLVDEDRTNWGHHVRSRRILGNFEALPQIVEDLSALGRPPHKIVITDPDMDGRDVRRLLEICDALGIGLARAPRLTDLQASDGSSPVDVHPIDLRDLLGRPQKVLDRTAIQNMVAGKRVLITGAGGTIGAELTRQVAALEPDTLVILDNSEFNLYQVNLEMEESFSHIERKAFLSDVRNKDEVTRVFKLEKPDIVFHAAALKHVPLVEQNPAEGILTNVAGTRHVADACLSHDVDAMVMISTDKAVNPSSVMGASKRVAELYCQAQGVAQETTRFVTVRFGNVLGSTGSVVPLFQRQLARGGPLTVTDKDVKRYFMTTREAVELVLQAATLKGEGGPTSATPPSLSAAVQADGRIYVLDMGEPIRILDLALRVIQLAGLKPYEDIDIKFTGLRPGEKLHESLFHDSEQLVPTKIKGIFLATPRLIDLQHLVPALEQLLAAAEARHTKVLYDLIRQLVPTYTGRPQTGLVEDEPAGQPLSETASPTLH